MQRLSRYPGCEQSKLFGQRLDILAEYEIIVFQPAFQAAGADLCPAVFLFQNCAAGSPIAFAQNFSFQRGLGPQIEDVGDIGDSLVIIFGGSRSVGYRNFFSLNTDLGNRSRRFDVYGTAVGDNTFLCRFRQRRGQVSR